MWIIVMETIQKETNKGKYMENKIKRVSMTER